MNTRTFNWPIWCGLLMALVALITYPSVFVRYPATRDFPWATFLVFAVAAVLVLQGLRRGRQQEKRRSRIIARVVAGFAVAIFVLFVLAFFVGGRQLPASQGAPTVGKKAPEFQLTDTKGKQVSLADLLSEPVAGKPPKGVLLVFYRGYW